MFGLLAMGPWDCKQLSTTDRTRERGTAFVLVTHDASLATRCHRRVTLHQGRLLDNAS